MLLGTPFSWLSKSLEFLLGNPLRKCYVDQQAFGVPFGDYLKEKPKANIGDGSRAVSLVKKPSAWGTCSARLIIRWSQIGWQDLWILRGSAFGAV